MFRFICFGLLLYLPTLFVYSDDLQILKEYSHSPLTLKHEGVVARLQEPSQPQPSEGSEVDDESEWVVSGGVIYWKARATDSMYVVRGSTSNFALPFRSELGESQFGYDFGMRWALGWYPGYDDWCVEAVYTDFSTQTSTKVAARQWGDLKSPVGFSLPMTDLLLEGSNETEVFFQNAASSYRIHYQTVDACISRPYQAGSIVFTPQIGLEGAFLSAKQDNTYSGGETLSNNTLKTNKNSRYWGVGPRSGVVMGWALRDGFSLIQDFAFSLLVGSLQSRYSENYSPTTTSWMNLIERDARFVPHASTSIGIGYDRAFNKKIRRVRSNLVFEGHFLWNFVQKVISGDDYDPGNLYFYGFNLQLSADF